MCRLRGGLDPPFQFPLMSVSSKMHIHKLIGTITG